MRTWKINVRCASDGFMDSFELTLPESHDDLDAALEAHHEIDRVYGLGSGMYVHSVREVS